MLAPINLGNTMILINTNYPWNMSKSDEPLETDVGKRRMMLKKICNPNHLPESLVVNFKAGVPGKCKAFQYCRGSHRTVLRWAVSTSPGN